MEISRSLEKEMRKESKGERTVGDHVSGTQLSVEDQDKIRSMWFLCFLQDMKYQVAESS